ncbi:MAG: flagellar hook-basal body complex protein, partial [Holosporales bacterium]|nr:flagellar hook-basal body complex protein [Holosporales bacterium]
MFLYLNNAVYGYRAQAQKMRAIGENIANSTTSGYKAHEVRFQDLSSKKPTLIGKEGASGGVRPIASINILAQGTLQTTSHGGDLAVDGQGLLPVREGLSSQGPLCGLRTGSFRLNKDGYMTNEAGYILQGRRLDAQNSSDPTSLEAVCIDLRTQKSVTAPVQTLPPSLPSSPNPESPSPVPVPEPTPSPPISPSPFPPSLPSPVEEGVFPYIPLPLYPEPGKEYSFSLTVSDLQGDTHTATITGTGESTRLLKKTLNDEDKSSFQKAFYELDWVSNNGDTAWEELVANAEGTWTAVETVLTSQNLVNNIAASAGISATIKSAMAPFGYPMYTFWQASGCSSGNPHDNLRILLTCVDKMAVLDSLFKGAGVADSFSNLLQKNGIKNGIEKLEEKLGGVRLLSERLHLSFDSRSLSTDLWNFLDSTLAGTSEGGTAAKEALNKVFDNNQYWYSDRGLIEIDAAVRASSQGKSLFDFLEGYSYNNSTLLQVLMTDSNYRFMQYGEELLRRVLDEGSLESLYNDTWTLVVEDIDGGTPLLSGGTFEVTANGDIQYDPEIPPTLHVTWDNEEQQDIPLEMALLKTSTVINAASDRGTIGIKLAEQKRGSKDASVLICVTDTEKEVHMLDFTFNLNLAKFYV